MNTIELKKYGSEQTTETRFATQKDVDVFKIKDKELSEFEFAILKFLFENKNKFVEREKVIEIRKQFYRNPNKARNVAPEISRIIGIINKTFQETEIPFEILSANGKIGLFINE